jgi:hypothetical protein
VNTLTAKTNKASETMIVIYVVVGEIETQQTMVYEAHAGLSYAISVGEELHISKLP